jgi:hypothetical protein
METEWGRKSVYRLALKRLWTSGQANHTSTLSRPCTLLISKRKKFTASVPMNCSKSVFQLRAGSIRCRTTSNMTRGKMPKPLVRVESHKLANSNFIFPIFHVTEADNEIKSLRLQLKLMFLQLQFERYRREVHAERNRRLAGKSRSVRALDELNAALVRKLGNHIYWC